MQAGITRDTPDPIGGSYGHDATGALDGSAYEMPAVFAVAGHAVTIGDDFPALVAAECARLNAAGITTIAELSFDPKMRPALAAIADARTAHHPPAALRDVQRRTHYRGVTGRRKRPGAPDRHQGLVRTVHRGSVTSPPASPYLDTEGHPRARDRLHARARQLHRRTDPRHQFRLLRQRVADGVPRPR